MQSLRCLSEQTAGILAGKFFFLSAPRELTREAGIPPVGLVLLCTKNAGGELSNLICVMLDVVQCLSPS